MLAPVQQISTPISTPIAAPIAAVTPDAAAGGGDPSASLDTALAVFLAHRTRLFRIARRITGDTCIAEDVVQEAWLRWQRTDRGAIRNPAAFLTTTTTHLAINVIQSARARHEAPTDSPVLHLVVDAEDPTRRAEQAADVADALFVLMARLKPAELAAYLLRKGFDYPYVDIARLLGTSSANGRQLVRRAQQGIDSDRGRPVDTDAHRELVAAFLLAAGTGDLASLERLLSRSSARCLRRRAASGSSSSTPLRTPARPRTA